MIDFTIKNYRCFPDSKPARFTVRPGFTGFIGANNSGKSSLLRFFYEFRGLFALLGNVSYFHSLVAGGTQAFGPAPSVKDLADMFCDTNVRDLTIEMQFEAIDQSSNPLQIRLTITVPRNTNQFNGTMFLPEDKRQAKSPSDILYVAGNTIKIASESLNIDLTSFLQTCRDLQNSLYIGPFRNAINVGTAEQYFDIQAGQSFVKAWRTYKTGSVRQQNEAAYRITEEIGRIFEVERLEINPSPDDQTLQVFVNGKSYKLNEIGSGLTQFIIVLANAAMKKPAYILIDEPELNLHPSLQVDFLTTLTSYAERGVLFSTHNMGLARASAERVYAVRRLAQGESEVNPLEALPRLSDFVGELGFSGYKELGFDQLLLVEGATEVRTIQQFLRFLGKEHQVVIVPLGGSALINGERELELQELTRISPNVAALIDSERDSEAAALSLDREGFRNICAANRINCCVLQRRATEHYLTDSAVKRVKGPKYAALGPYQHLNDISPSWAKAENWRIAREMQLDDIRETDLGQFLTRL
jgi:predicted ATPase